MAGMHAGCPGHMGSRGGPSNPGRRPLIGCGGKRQLTDFGLSRVLGDLASHVSTRTYGTISFMPPELIRDAKLSKAADVYSFGILMWETFCSKTAYGGVPAATVRPHLPPSFSLPLQDPPCPSNFSSCPSRILLGRPALSLPLMHSLYPSRIILAPSAFSLPLQLFFLPLPHSSRPFSIHLRRSSSPSCFLGPPSTSFKLYSVLK
jgi:serine/threonine protein kinase